MKKVAMYYFSGTQNTKKMVDTYCKAFQNNGYAVDVVTVKDACQMVKYRRSEWFYKYDLRVVAFPVHAFSAPEPILTFLRALPQYTPHEGKNAPRFVLVTTSGEPLLLNDAAAAQAARILIKKGYAVQAAYRYVMPYNMIFRHTNAYAQAMFSTMRALVKIDAAEVLGGQKNLPRVGGLKRLIAALFAVEHKAMHYIGRGFKASADCVSCGKCVRGCPQQNITLKNGCLAFGSQCVGCMRCSFFCPKQAIRIGLLNGWRVCGAYSDNQAVGAAVPTANVSDKPHYQRFMRKRYEAYFQNAKKKIAKHAGAIEIAPKTE